MNLKERIQQRIQDKNNNAIPARSKIQNSIIESIKRKYRINDDANLHVSEIHPDYYVAVNDYSIKNPFMISSGLVKIIRNHVEPYNLDEDKSKAIYDWFQENINYGTSKRANGYKNSNEVLSSLEGVCGEMAYLYISMVRCTGMKSSFVYVQKDMTNKKVKHACAVVHVSRDIYVDPAYKTYDIKHQKTKIWDDNKVIYEFTRWRKKTA